MSETTSTYERNAPSTSINSSPQFDITCITVATTDGACFERMLSIDHSTPHKLHTVSKILHTSTSTAELAYT